MSIQSLPAGGLARVAAEGFLARHAKILAEKNTVVIPLDPKKRLTRHDLVQWAKGLGADVFPSSKPNQHIIIKPVVEKKAA